MEFLTTLNYEVVELIFEYSLLDLGALEHVTQDEVYAAAELAVQMSTRPESPPAGDRPPANDRPEGRSNSPRESPGHHPDVSPPPLLEADGATGGVIGPEERREILADEVEEDADEEGDGELCAACGGESGEKRQLPCGCHYCAACLRRCIRVGLRNEESWPPRCHFRLSAADVAWTDRPDLLRLWGQRAAEWDSPPADRVYCSRPACAAFIPGRRPDGEARCGACGEGTCPGCRTRWHPGVPCEEAAEDEGLMEMMDRYRYTWCDNCRRILEFIGGCNHIT